MYNKIDINNVASTTRKEVGYRSNISSNEINEFNDTVLNDLLDLFNKANNISKELDENKMIIDSETNHLKYKIKRLEGELETLQNKYNSLIGDNKVQTKYIYPVDVVTNNLDSTAYVDTIFNSITMTPVSSESKTFIYDELYDKSFVPPTLYVDTEYVNINPKVDIIKTEENDITNCMCSNNNKYWIRQVTTNADVKEIVGKIYITLPDDVITTRNINEVLVKPYPTNALDIISIEYVNHNDIKNAIPTFSEFAINQSDFNIIFNPDTEEYELADVDSIKLNFKDISATQIIITFRQKYYNKNIDNTNTFTFGFKDIDIRNNKYSNSYNTFQFEVDFNTNKIVTLSDVVPVITNNTQMDNKSITFDFYSVTDTGSINKILDKLPFVCPTNKLLVKGKMFSNNCTPNVTKFKVNYLLNN